MKKQLRSSFEFEEVEYEYTAQIYSGDDAYIHPDETSNLNRIDRKRIGDVEREDVEFFALLHAYLVEWYEGDGWSEEKVGVGCSVLSKASSNGSITRIRRAKDRSVPLSMGEPVVIGRYDSNGRLLGDAQLFRGGINEWIADPSVSKKTPYANIIMRFAKKLGRPKVNPRWIDAYIRLEHPSLNGLCESTFEREVATAISCIDALGPEKAENTARSFGA